MSAAQRDTTADQQSDHPAWCSQGEYCDGPRRYPNGTIEWSHGGYVDVDSDHRRCDVFLVRIENLQPDGAHNVDSSVQLEVSGAFTTDDTAALIVALLRATVLHAAGLAGTPGGLQAVMAAAERGGHQ